MSQYNPSAIPPESPDVSALSADEFDAFTIGYRWGYIAGIERGRELADEDAATLHREAVRIVHAMAKIEPRDPETDEARARRRAEWWTSRRSA